MRQRKETLIKQMMDGFDPELDMNDRHILYEVTKLKTENDEFNDSDSSAEDLNYSVRSYSEANSSFVSNSETRALMTALND